MKNEFLHLLAERGIHVEDAEDILYAVSDLLHLAADKMRKEEPYAAFSINQMETAAHTVFSLVNELDS